MRDTTTPSLNFELSPEAREKLIRFYCEQQQPPDKRYRKPADIPNTEGYRVQALVCNDGVTVRRENAVVVVNAQGLHLLHSEALQACLRISRVVGWIPN